MTMDEMMDAPTTAPGAVTSSAASSAKKAHAAPADAFTFAAVIARFEAACRVRRFAARTWPDTYKPVLDDLFAFLEDELGIERISDVTPDALRRFQHRLMTEPRPGRKTPLKASTVAVRTAVVRALFQWAERDEIVFRNPAATLLAPRVREQLPRGLLSRREAERLLAAPDVATAAGRRDRAMLEVLYGTGVRVSELCGLGVDDLETEERTLHVRGKGDRPRLVPLGRRAFAAVLEYVEGGARDELAARGAGCAQLFVSVRGGALRRHHVLHLVKRYAAKAKIKRAATVHGLRHTFGTHLLRGGADIRSVQEILGHKTLKTTERYTHLTTADLRKEILRHHPRERIE